MNRFVVAACAMVVVLGSTTLLAQGRGRHGGGAPGGSNDTSIADFKLALAIQANQDQVAQFESLSKSTTSAQKQAQDLQQKTASPVDPGDLVRLATVLKGSVDDAVSDSQNFLRDFSKLQKAQLKELTKKLEKSSADVAKEGKTLDQLLKASKTDASEFSTSADRLQKALADFRTRQLNLADPMGIQPAPQ